MKTSAEVLRGTLKEHTVDARRIMQAAKNPACAVSRTAMLAGIDMEEMAKRAFGEALESHLSPFAIRQGNVFEHWITENGASRLLDALVKNGILGPTYDHEMTQFAMQQFGMPSRRPTAS